MVTETLVAGPERDAEVARRVFEIDVLGLAPCHHAPDGCELEVGSWDTCDDVARPVYVEYSPCACEFDSDKNAILTAYPDNERYFEHHRSCLEPVQLYSTDIAAAWLVVEKMRERGYTVIEIHADCFHNVYGWCAYIGKEDEASHVACEGVFTDTAPLAICRAALAALEHD